MHAVGARCSGGGAKEGRKGGKSKLRSSPRTPWRSAIAADAAGGKIDGAYSPSLAPPPGRSRRREGGRREQSCAALAARLPEAGRRRLRVLRPLRWLLRAQDGGGGGRSPAGLGLPCGPRARSLARSLAAGLRLSEAALPWLTL